MIEKKKQGTSQGNPVISEGKRKISNTRCAIRDTVHARHAGSRISRWSDKSQLLGESDETGGSLLLGSIR